MMVCKIKIASIFGSRCLFKVFCVICVLCMILYWLYKFEVEDRDVGIVEYRSFKNEPKISYPVASMCFYKPFSRKKITQVDPNINITDYLRYLKGNVVKKELQNVDYFSISLDLDDYLNGYSVQLRNGTELEETTVGHFSNKVNFNGYSEWGWFEKCFELSWKLANNGPIKESFVSYNVTELLKDAWYSPPLEFGLYIHYPGQFLIAPTDPTYLKLFRNQKSLEVIIDDIEILKSRNTRKRKCTPYVEKPSFDDMVKEKYLDATGCTVPYFGPFEGFPTCDTTEKMKESVFYQPNAGTNYYPISCQRLSKVLYRTVWQDTVKDFRSNADEFIIGIIYPNYFRNIELNKEVDIHSLIGNVGGYVGLFLGNRNHKTR